MKKIDDLLSETTQYKQLNWYFIHCKWVLLLLYYNWKYTHWNDAFDLYSYFILLWVLLIFLNSDYNYATNK